jgi:hypothetical protein
MLHLVWAGVVVYGIWRFAQVLDRFAPVRSTTPDGDAVVEVPADLVGMAMRERELWAQEEMVRAMRERYNDLRDWNLVRSAFGAAPTPER